ncbi:MAG: MarR family transcriptional regulator [Saprospiraceae bacterium]|nr:MarR family transcriptional regulator [Saprospiraceae bacterium]
MLSSENETNRTITPTITLNNHQKPFILKKTLDESIVIGLFSLADNLTKIGDAHCQRYGITTMQYLIMLHLAGDPNIGYAEDDKMPQIVASDLAEVLNVSRPNISNLLNALIEKNLVQQVRAKTDWRRKWLILTEEGWALLEKLQPLRHRTNNRLLSHLSKDEKVAFLDSIQTCLDLVNNRKR